MKKAEVVGLLAVVGTFSHLLDSWIPDSALSSICMLGKGLDLEGRVSQYAYYLLTGEYPDPSSAPFLLWAGIRFVAGALLLYGVTTERRRGNWLRPYQLQLQLSLVLWLATVAYCVVRNILPFVAGLLVAAGTYFVLFYEDPVEREQRGTREAHLASERRRLAVLRQARGTQAAAANTTPSVVRYLVTISPVFFGIQNVTTSTGEEGNPTRTSTATSNSVSPPHVAGDSTTPAAEVSE